MLNSDDFVVESSQPEFGVTLAGKTNSEVHVYFAAPGAPASGGISYNFSTKVMKLLANEETVLSLEDIDSNDATALQILTRYSGASHLERIKTGPAGSGPDGEGRALFVPGIGGVNPPLTRSFETRAAFEAWVAAGGSAPKGSIVTAGGTRFQADPAAVNYLEKLNGWKFAADTKVILWLGQSNARSPSDSTGGDKSLHPRVAYWNGTANTPGSLYRFPTIGSYPFVVTTDGGATYSNSMPYASGRQLAIDTGAAVHVLQYAWGGQHAAAFVTPAGRTANGWSLAPDGLDMTIGMYPGIANALSRIPGGKSYVDAICIHQGELDKGNWDVWRAQWAVVLNELEAAGVYNRTETRVIFGQIADSEANAADRTPQFAATAKLKDATLGNIGFVRSDKLPLEDPLHFDGESLVQMGKRYAADIIAPRDISSLGLIEYGKTGNNECWRWADGTQRCRTIIDSVTCDSALGALYRSPADIEWTFLKQFIEPPGVHGNVLSGSADIWTSGIGNVGMFFRRYSAVSDATGRSVKMTADGKWF